MITEINRYNLAAIRNPRFAAYAAMYLDIGEGFLRKVGEARREFEWRGAAEDRRPVVKQAVGRLKQRGVTFRNGGKSAFINWISPACLACQKGTGQRDLLHLAPVQPPLLLLLQPESGRFCLLLGHQRDCRAELDRSRPASKGWTSWL